MSESIGNAFRRGLKMNEMSEYSYDFFTNAADQSDFEKFIEISEELGEIPTSSAAKKFQQYKSKGFWDSVSNLLFDNTEAIPELFVESLSSFLPAYVRTGFKTIPGGAAVGGAAGLAGGPLAPVTVTGGALSGAGGQNEPYPGHAELLPITRPQPINLCIAQLLWIGRLSL